MIWSEESRVALADERRLEEWLEDQWEFERAEAFARDFEETDHAQALFEWSQGLRP